MEALELLLWDDIDVEALELSEVLWEEVEVPFSEELCSFPPPPPNPCALAYVTSPIAAKARLRRIFVDHKTVNE